MDKKAFYELRVKRANDAKEIVLNHMKCYSCNWCCTIPNAQIDLGEAKTIAKFLGFTNFKKFVRRYITYNMVMEIIGQKYDFDDFKIMRTAHLKAPCSFLKENKCIIYQIRPKSCRFFPFHTEQPIINAVDKCKMAQEIMDELSKISFEEAEKFRTPIDDAFEEKSQSIPVLTPDKESEAIKCAVTYVEVLEALAARYINPVGDEANRSL